MISTPPAALPAFSDPIQFTVCVLLYGDHPELAKRCLGPLAILFRAGLIDLRIGCNQISDKTRSVLNHLGLLADPRVGLIDSSENLLKYPMMRHLFALRPLAPYTMWFDDDSCATGTDKPELSNWLREIAILMAQTDQLGQIWTLLLGGNQHLWVQDQPFYGGTPVPPRHKVQFCTGGWWVIRSDVLTRWNWPVPDIRHRGGDVMLGELMRQQGLRMWSRHPGVLINAEINGKHASSPRRGYDSKPVGWTYTPGISSAVLAATESAPDLSEA